MNKRVRWGIVAILVLALGVSPAVGVAATVEKTAGLTASKGPDPLPAPRDRKTEPPVKARTQSQIVGESRTLLPGGRTLVVGGQGADGPLETATIIDPRTGETIQLAGGLIHARAWHTATLLPDGKVLVLGGVGENDQLADSAEIIDLDAQMSRPLFSPGLTTARAYHTATLLTDGRVLIAGGLSGKGRVLDGAELWDFRGNAVEKVPGRLNSARKKQRATLQPDGGVLLEGGVDDNGNEVAGSELFNPESGNFSFAGAPPATSHDAAPYLSGSVPAGGAAEVATQALIGLRFSKALRVETVNAATVTLNGPQGAVTARVVAAEQGRLAFVTPLLPLSEATTYTVTVSGAGDGVAAASISFTTVGKSRPDRRAPDDEAWVPDGNNLHGNWKSKRAEYPAQSLPPLQAAPGVTALAGQVLTLNGRPLPNVTLRVEDKSATTDDTGRFLLSDLAPGHHVMRIDGRTAGRPNRTYGMFKAGVDLLEGKTNALGYTVWMPKLDTANAVNITSPTAGEVVVTNPAIPGLELHLPPQTVIRGPDGETVNQITLTPIPTNQPPFPLPPGVDVPVYFTIQPGGSQVIPPRARLVYPNFMNAAPGSRIDFYNYDATEKGWYIYGKGTVTADRRQIVPDPGVVLYEFSGAMIASPSYAPPEGPPPGSCGRGGDPVDLATGLFLNENTDLSLPDTIAVTLTRTYRQRDTISRAFGIGSTHPYDMFLVGDTFPYTYQEVILPDGGRIRLNRISPGTSWTDAVYEHTSSPTIFYKSRLSWNGNGWDLKLKNGTTYVFPEAFNVARAAQGGLIGIRDRYGNFLKLDRTSVGNLTKITTPNGRWIELTYDASNRVTQAKDNIGRTVNYTYDASGRLWKVSSPHMASETFTETVYTYDTSHRMLTVTDPRGNQFVANVYDTSGRIIKQTQADGSTFLFSYTTNSGGKVTQTDLTDQRGNVRRVSFDANGYIATDTYAFGTTEQQVIAYERDAVTNLLKAVVSPAGTRTTYAYDAQGNTTDVIRNAGTTAEAKTSYTYEPAFNQQATVTDPLNHTLSFAYDSNGNLASITDPLSHTTSYGYNAKGQLISVTDALGKTINFGYEGADLTSITDPLGRTTTQFVDDAGRLLGETDPLGNLKRYDYDSLDRLVKSTDPLGGATSYTYDANDNLLTLTDARGKVTGYAYDSMNRVITRTDPLAKSESFQYDGARNLVKSTDRRGLITEYRYDRLNRRVFVGYGAVIPNKGATTYQSTISYTYSAGGCGCAGGTGGRPTSIVDSAAGTITRTYDPFDRLLSETTPQGKVSYTYDAAGGMTSMTVLGQPTVNYTFDDGNRLVGISQGANTVGLGYDALNRRTSLTLPNGVVVSYAFNDAAQLTNVTFKKGATEIGQLSYGYDAGGRRTAVGGTYARTGLPQPLASAVYNDANRLTQRGTAALTYDGNGNLTNDGTNTYSWNARDELASISGPGLSASFQYDAFGRRTSRTVNGGQVGYLYNGLNAAQELSGATPTANLLTGRVDEVFTRTSGSGTDTLVADGLNTTLAILDPTGAVKTQYSYEPFGKTAASGAASTNDVQYAGRPNDGTGLYFNRARYYSPLLQRFISEDPIEFAGGLNLYAYVENSPVAATDPLGLMPGNEEYCRRLLERINNLIKKIKEREGELDENPQNLPEACPGDNKKPSLSRRGHRKLINMDKADLARRQAEYLAYCSNRPPRVPVTAPAPEDNYFDLKYWETVTGLTGAALILYLIISEGSRLYPPRNLVPVP